MAEIDGRRVILKKQRDKYRIKKTWGKTNNDNEDLETLCKNTA